MNHQRTKMNLQRKVYKMDASTLWMGIAEASLNYIVVSTISGMNQKQTVSDVKTDLRTTKEDIMAEMKDTRENLIQQIEDVKMKLSEENKKNG